MIECWFEVFIDWNPVEMTKKCGDIRIRKIGRQCLDVLGM